MSVPDGEQKSICDISTYVKPFIDSYSSCIDAKGNIESAANLKETRNYPQSTCKGILSPSSCTLSIALN